MSGVPRWECRWSSCKRINIGNNATCVGCKNLKDSMPSDEKKDNNVLLLDSQGAASDDSVTPRLGRKSPPKKSPAGKKNPVDSESEFSFESRSPNSRRKPARKPSRTTLKDDESSDEQPIKRLSPKSKRSSSSDTGTPVIKRPKPTSKTSTKTIKAEDSSSDSSESTPARKPSKVSTKKSNRKADNSSSGSSDDQPVKLSKKASKPARKQAQKRRSSSSSSSSSSSNPETRSPAKNKKSPKAAKKLTKRQSRDVSSSSSSSSASEPVKNKKPKKSPKASKKLTKKRSSSSSSSSSESEKEKIPKKSPKASKKLTKKQTASSDSSSESEKAMSPKKSPKASKKLTKKQTASESSSSDSDSGKAAPKKSPKASKKLTKNQTADDSSCDSDANKLDNNDNTEQVSKAIVTENNKKPKPSAKQCAESLTDDKAAPKPKPKPKPKKKNPEDVRETFHCPRHRLTKKRALGVAADWSYECEICEDEIETGFDFLVCTSTERCTYALCESCYIKQNPGKAKKVSSKSKTDSALHTPTDAKRATLGTRVRPMRTGSDSKTGSVGKKLPSKGSCMIIYCSRLYCFLTITADG